MARRICAHAHTRVQSPHPQLPTSHVLPNRITIIGAVRHGLGPIKKPCFSWKSRVLFYGVFRTWKTRKVTDTWPITCSHTSGSDCQRLPSETVRAFEPDSH